MKSSIFISRSLNDNSPFLKLKNDGHDIIDQSLIDITPVHIEDYPTTEWIFFYSANGVKYFFESQEYSTKYQYGVIGTGTANTFYSVTGRSPKYTGNGIPKDIAENFITYERGQSILFVKAQNSKDSVKNLLLDDMVCEDLIVYGNVMKSDFYIPTCDHLIFTSPMNVEAYLSKYAYLGEQLYAIGQGTADSILSLCGTEAKVSKTTSEYGLYELVAQELNQK
jgi:uroporphyrinogen-III synthase